ncbi:MAG: flagellar biosynthesis protein FliQ [Candidatus Sumerlaeota bacterium]|nr:flagellar biosynthesis protein FliQ [Candidatus Sumerlaeota bacterium]
MAPDPIIDVMQEALYISLFLSLPPLLLTLVVGLVVSIFQAVTSIQEQTMVFIPKIIAASLALLVFMPWMVSSLVDFTARILQMTAQFAK